MNLTNIITDLKHKHNVFIKYDSDANIINANDYVVDYYGFNAIEQLYGKSIFELSWQHQHNNHPRITDLHYKSPQQLISLILMGDNLYLDYKEPHLGGVVSFSNNITTNSSYSAMINYSNQLIKRYGINIVSLVNTTMIDLSEREQLIIFLLLIGHTQDKIASYLQISRSFVAKIIGENLCPKFNSIGYSASILKDKLIADGYHHFIPTQLVNSVNIPNMGAALNFDFLNTLQQQVVNGLLLNMTQNEIASQLNCSRANVSKIILSQLCPLLAVNHSSTKALIDKLRWLEVNHQN